MYQINMLCTLTSAVYQQYPNENIISWGMQETGGVKEGESGRHQQYITTLGGCNIWKDRML